MRRGVASHGRAVRTDVRHAWETRARGQGFALPYPSVQIQDLPGLVGKERSTGKNPVRVLPGLNRIGLQDAPDRTPADRFPQGWAGATGEVRQRLAAQGLVRLGDQLAREGFDDGMIQRGKKRLYALAPAHPPVRSPPGPSGASSAAPSQDEAGPSVLLRHGRAGAVHAEARRAPHVGATETSWDADEPSGGLAPGTPRENTGGRSVRDLA